MENSRGQAPVSFCKRDIACVRLDSLNPKSPPIDIKILYEMPIKALSFFFNSTEHFLHEVALCGRMRLRFLRCSKGNTVRVTIARYSNCTCMCDSCVTIPFPDACVQAEDFNKILKNCHGKRSCILRQGKKGNCKSSRKRVLKITYTCIALNFGNRQRRDDDDDDDDDDDHDDDDDDDDDVSDVDDDVQEDDHDHDDDADDDDADDNDDDDDEGGGDGNDDM